MVGRKEMWPSEMSSSSFKKVLVTHTFKDFAFVNSCYESCSKADTVVLGLGASEVYEEQISRESRVWLYPQ